MLKYVFDYCWALVIKTAINDIFTFLECAAPQSVLYRQGTDVLNGLSILYFSREHV